MAAAAAACAPEREDPHGPADDRGENDHSEGVPHDPAGRVYRSTLLRDLLQHHEEHDRRAVVQQRHALDGRRERRFGAEFTQHRDDCDGVGSRRDRREQQAHVPPPVGVERLDERQGDGDADEHRGECKREGLGHNLAEDVEIDRIRRFEKQRGQEDVEEQVRIDRADRRNPSDVICSRVPPRAARAGSGGGGGARGDGAAARGVGARGGAARGERRRRDRRGRRRRGRSRLRPFQLSRNVAEEQADQHEQHLHTTPGGGGG